jgi:hypothetical protein
MGGNITTMIMANSFNLMGDETEKNKERIKAVYKMYLEEIEKEAKNATKEMEAMK